MCLIIDNNVASQVLVDREHPDFSPIYRSIESRRTILIHGGQLTKEYSGNRRVMEALEELDRIGAARRISDTKIGPELSFVHDSGRCISDDPHIIALARASGARVLCSLDRDLATDFKNPRLLSPKGKVYKRREHARRLLATACLGCH